MSNSYIVREGDTYDSIARKTSGDDRQSGVIRKANPGTSGKLIAGTVIKIPGKGKSKSGSSEKSDTSVVLNINGAQFDLWETIRVETSIDAIPTATFSSPFDGNDTKLREIFKPLQFKNVDIDVGKDRVFTGTLVASTPNMSESGTKVSASCYALPGVFVDCTTVAETPMEWDDADLKTIAESLAEPFGIDVAFGADFGASFTRVRIKEDEKIMPFLSGLASQRGLVISSSPTGALYFLKESTSKTKVATLVEGKSPLIKVTPSFDPQSFYSSITGISPTVAGLVGKPFTEKNNHLNDVIRPLTFISNNTSDADLSESVKSKAGRMFSSVVTYSVEVASWRDESGELWWPNTFISVNSPSAMIYSESTFLIRSVILNKTSSKETATLNLILPGSFAGKIPEKMPWDI